MKKSSGCFMFTSECVSSGHPDKICDYISDKILDECLSIDKGAHVAVETLCTTNYVCLAGEVSSSINLTNDDYVNIVKTAVKELGYTSPTSGFYYDDLVVDVRIHKQSEDIAMGVDREDGAIGAGDQGMVFGCAVRETEDLMPLPITIARRLIIALSECGNKDFEPDAKSQVTVCYDKHHNPIGIDSVVISVSHSNNISIKDLRAYVKSNIIAPVLKSFGYDIKDVKNIYINPTGRFTIYGPNGDTGLTGRKIIVDTYGGYTAHGGGAFSSKDPTKVDRSGAMMARYIAKNIVAAELADRCDIQMAYAIGVPNPISINIKCYGTNKYPISLIAKAVYKVFDTTVAGTINSLKLRDIKYKDFAIYGTFGSEGNLERPWEVCSKTEALSKYCKENYVER